MINLHGKWILITGASSGIGRTVAQFISSLGASVILVGRNVERLEETMQTLSGDGHISHSIDLTDYIALESWIRSIVNKERQISGLVHCAGIEKTLPFKASTPKIFKEIFEINVFAGFEIARILSQKGIFDERGASFIFLSSVMGIVGEPGKIAYCSSKSALLSGVKAMALELAGKRIRCNCILSGMVETEMAIRLFESISPEAKQKIINKHPLGLGKPIDVAALVSFLLSDQASWVTGSDYIIDGGYSAQ